MLTDELVFCNVTPICSAIARNKLLNISSKTGSDLTADECVLTAFMCVDLRFKIKSLFSVISPSVIK